MWKLIRIVFLPLILVSNEIDVFCRKWLYRSCPHCEDGKLHSRSSDANYSVTSGPEWSHFQRFKWSHPELKTHRCTSVL
jgi:hypothetical protein